MSTAFLTEFQLVEQFVNTETMFSSKMDRILELESSNGIADIVFYQPSQYVNQACHLALVEPRWGYALYRLPFRQYFSIKEFASLVGTSHQTALNALYSYAAAGYCELNAQNKLWIKFKQPQRIAHQIIAIEAKLKDWRRALKQANRYRDYANQSWVLLDEHHAKPASKNISRFQHLNIGLASFSSTENFRVIWEPEYRKPKSELANWVANFTIARQGLSASILDNNG